MTKTKTINMKRTLHRMVALLLASGTMSCAAAYDTEAPVSAEAGPPGAETPTVQYERILGSFVVDPDVAIYLNPSLCERLCERSWEIGIIELEKVANDFAQLGARRGYGAASLNRGALLWFASRPEDSYRAVMAARDTFAGIGDLHGLAHSLEWLGYIFGVSDAPQAAAEQLALAYRLFEKLGNRRAATRVLAYGGP